MEWWEERGLSVSLLPDMFACGSSDRVLIPPDLLCDLGNWPSISGLQGSLLKCKAHAKSKNGHHFLSTYNGPGSEQSALLLLAHLILNCLVKEALCHAYLTGNGDTEGLNKPLRVPTASEK